MCENRSRGRKRRDLVAIEGRERDMTGEEEIEGNRRDTREKEEEEILGIKGRRKGRNQEG